MLEKRLITLTISSFKIREKRIEIIIDLSSIKNLIFLFESFLLVAGSLQSDKTVSVFTIILIEIATIIPTMIPA